MYQQNVVIISCAITGAIHTPSMSPYLPVTPEDIAESSIAAAKAGAAIIHLHARDPETGIPDQQHQLIQTQSGAARIDARHPISSTRLLARGCAPRGTAPLGSPLLEPKQKSDSIRRTPSREPAADEVGSLRNHLKRVSAPASSQTRHWHTQIKNPSGERKASPQCRRSLREAPQAPCPRAGNAIVRRSVASTG